MMDRKVLVISRKAIFDIFGGWLFTGFKKAEKEVIRLIEKEAIWMDKKESERHPDYKQIIGYCPIINVEEKLYFFYQRSKKISSYEEERLLGNWSLGVGGHIESCDGALDGIILKSIERELSEEVGIKEDLDISFVGGINDEDDVGKAHFGLCFLIKTKAEKIIPTSDEIAFGRLRSIKDIDTIFSMKEARIESWTNILRPIIEKGGS